MSAYLIRQIVTDTIEITRSGVAVSPAHAILRKFAADLSVPVVNSMGNPLNTRSLGCVVIREIQRRYDAE
jgi:predicted phosphoribosyltransferase